MVVTPEVESPRVENNGERAAATSFRAESALRRYSLPIQKKTKLITAAGSRKTGRTTVITTVRDLGR